jgi:hypothetical protein
MRYRLRTLLIVLAVGPIVLMVLWQLCQPPEQRLPEAWIGVQDIVYPAPAEWPPNATRTR